MSSNPEPSPRLAPGWAAYVAPIAAFVLLSTLEQALPRAWYPVAYGVKVLLVTAVAIACRSTWGEARPRAADLLPALLVGLAAFALWIGLDRWPGYPHLTARAGFDPFAALPEPAARGLFLAARFYGLVVLIPLIEELFWRSFLLRYAARPEDFRSLQPWQATPAAILLCAVAFALAHPEWLAAFVTSLLYTGLLFRRRSLFAPILAHAVTNLALGLYVVQTGAWRYW